MSEKLPPLKAKQAGRSGRKHTLASFPISGAGQILIYLECGCGCNGVFTLEELLEHVGYFKIKGKGRVA